YDQALELLAKKAQRGSAALRELGSDPTSGEVVDVREGRYGPYVKRGKVNASLPKDLSPDDVSLEQAIELLDARAAAAPSTRGRGKGTKAGNKVATKSTTRKPKSKSATASKAKVAGTAAGKPKATTAKTTSKTTAKTAAKAPAKAPAKRTTKRP